MKGGEKLNAKELIAAIGEIAIKEPGFFDDDDEFYKTNMKEIAALIENNVPHTETKKG